MQQPKKFDYFVIQLLDKGGGMVRVMQHSPTYQNKNNYNTSTHYPY
jgi:hypothetical protein